MGMKATERRTVDLSGYPDLVVIFLGMRVRTFAGIRTLMGFGPRIEQGGAARPEGLLHYENRIILGFFPPHVGMRWYWRDLESMEKWARSEPHQLWWRRFLKDSGGTGFWHEAYFMRGGMEGIYDDMGETRIGFQAFAPSCGARGTRFSARGRVAVPGEVAPPAGVAETDLYRE